MVWRRHKIIVLSLWLPVIAMLISCVTDAPEEARESQPTLAVSPRATPGLFEGCDRGEPTPLEFTRYSGVIGGHAIELDVPTAWSIEPEFSAQGYVYRLSLGRPHTCRAQTEIWHWHEPSTLINIIIPARFPHFWSASSDEWIAFFDGTDYVVTVLEEYESVVHGSSWPTIVGRVDRRNDPPPVTTSDQTPIFHTYPRINGTTYDFMMYAGADYENSRAIYEHVLGSVVISEN